MPYRGHTRFQCKGCGRPREVDERFSARGKCPGCGETAMIENRRELIAHNGPHFAHWRRRLLAAFGVSEVDARGDER